MLWLHFCLNVSCLPVFLLSVHLPSFTFSCPLSLPPPPLPHVFCMFTCHPFPPPVILFSSLCLFPCVQWSCFSFCSHHSTTSGNTRNMHVLQMGLQATCMHYKWNCKQHACTTNGTASNTHALQMELQAT